MGVVYVMGLTKNHDYQPLGSVEHGTSVWEVVGSYPDRTNIQGLSLTGEKVLPLVRLSSLLG